MRSLILGCFLLSSSVFAAQQPISCVIELSKGSCWKAHEIAVKVVSTSWPDIVTSLKLSKKEFYTQKQISCKAADSIVVNGTFAPPIWESDVGVTYKQTTQWHVPSRLPSGSDQFVVQVCFPKDFKGVPIPLGEFRSCECNFEQRATQTQ